MCKEIHAGLWKTFFETKILQSPGTYISVRTWDPSQRAITK